MIQTLEDVLVSENFIHCTHHLRGVVNEVVGYFRAIDTQVDYPTKFGAMADRLEGAMDDFGSALEAWADRLPDEEIEEVEETY